MNRAHGVPVPKWNSTPVPYAGEGLSLAPCVVLYRCPSCELQKAPLAGTFCPDCALGKKQSESARVVLTLRLAR